MYQPLPLPTGVCQIRARLTGHPPGLTENDGDRSGAAQVSERPGDRSGMSLYFQTGLRYAGADPTPATRVNVDGSQVYPMYLMYL